MITNFRYPDGSHTPLSNFWLVNVEFGGHEYPSTENAYQAAKVADRPHEMAQFTTCTPGQSKRIGRRVDLRSDWEQVKIPIMRDLVRIKFDLKTHPELAAYLLSTEPHELIEGNDWGDRIWGRSPLSLAHDPIAGENWLGFILMGVRAELKEVT